MAEKRALLIFPKMYSMVKAFEEGFRENGWEVSNHNNNAHISKIQKKINRIMRKFPGKLRARRYQYFLGQVNSPLLSTFHSMRPDIVLAYNSGMLLPETMREMQKSAKVCFYMGDSPFYPTRTDTYLSCLMQADMILCPDTYWGKQLGGLGIGSVKPFLIGSSQETNHVQEVSEEEKKKWGSDLVFIGITSPSTRGFKRILFLSQFCDFDMKIYTSRKIESWYQEFPQLQKRVVHPIKRLTDAELNTLLNCCKLYPVDSNTGMINGVHWRIFECIGSGILPLAEYRKDVKEIFGKEGLPIITNYKMAPDLAAYYLRNDNERKDIMAELRNFVEANYSPAQSIGRFLDDLRS
jgi:hypothetical protein